MADESETPVMFPGPLYQPEEVWMLWGGLDWVESIDNVAGHPSYLAYDSSAAATAAAEKHLAQYDIECVPVRIEPSRLAAALAAKEAECERLRACLEGASHRLASWAEQADLIRLGIDGIRGGLAAALAPPAGEGGGPTTPDDCRRFVARMAAMALPRDDGELDLLIRQARSLVAGEGGGE